MAHAVFIQNPGSIYDDAHGLHYHFPKSYLGMVRETVGDWVVFYEGKKGVQGYTHVQRVVGLRQDQRRDDHWYADLDPASMLDFETLVPRLDASGSPFEKRLPRSGGLNTSAVRRLTPAEFAAIVDLGLSEQPVPDTLPRSGSIYEVAEDQTPFEPAGLEKDRTRILTSRSLRDAAFARIVKRAYAGRCAISGLELRNGGGRPEVEAAHIRPVSSEGPDTVRNGLALTGTLHWMFDRGLISVAPDLRILISHNKVSPDVTRRLISPEQKLALPQNPRHHPHPEYLRYHRENIFGRLT